MSKVVITEERLQKLISEAINEAIEDEGLGRWLGNAYQWGRNKINNFKGEFNAGRNNQRWQNRDFDPYHGMKDADQMRNFNGDEYGQYRYNLAADRNNNAANSWQNEFGTTTNRNPIANGDRQTNYMNNGMAPGGQMDGQGGQGQGGDAPLPNAGGQPGQMPAAAAMAQQQQGGQQPQGQGGQQVGPAASAVRQPRIGAAQGTAQGFMQSLRAGQPFKINQSIKNYLTKAVNAYAKTYPTAVNNKYFDNIRKEIGKVDGGGMFDPRNVNLAKMQTLLNFYAKFNNWQLQEARLRKMIEESVRRELKKLNEVGDTPKGQKKLGKLAGKRMGQSWRAAEDGNVEKAMELGGRYKTAHQKARDEREAAGSDKKKSKMRDAYYKALDKQAELAESKSINEIGDTPRGQRALGKLSGRREREAFSDKNNDNQEGFKKKFTTSVEAYCKAKDERDAKYKDGDAAKSHMSNAFHKGEKEGKKLTNESVLQKAVEQSIKNVIAEGIDEKYDEYGVKKPNWFSMNFNKKARKQYYKDRYAAQDAERERQRKAERDAKQKQWYDNYNREQEKRNRAIENLVWLIRTTNMGSTPTFDNEYPNWKSRTMRELPNENITDLSNEAWRIAKMRGTC